MSKEHKYFKISEINSQKSLLIFYILCLTLNLDIKYNSMEQKGAVLLLTTLHCIPETKESSSRYQ